MYLNPMPNADVDNKQAKVLAHQLKELKEIGDEPGEQMNELVETHDFHDFLET